MSNGSATPDKHAAIEWYEIVPAGTPLWFDPDTREVKVKNRDGTFRAVGKQIGPAAGDADTPIEVPAP